MHGQNFRKFYFQNTLSHNRYWTSNFLQRWLWLKITWNIEVKFDKPLVYCIVKPCPHCRRKVRLSPKTATVAENGQTTATVAEFCDSRTFLRQSVFSAKIVAEIGEYSHQCGQALTRTDRAPQLVTYIGISIFRARVYLNVIGPLLFVHSDQ